jgi:hypothetical protein
MSDKVINQEAKEKALEKVFWCKDMKHIIYREENEVDTVWILRQDVLDLINNLYTEVFVSVE